eukprot:8564320-Pyramimonas_sp.AAC.1
MPLRGGEITAGREGRQRGSREGAERGREGCRRQLTFGHYSPDDHPDHEGRQRGGLLNEVVQAAHIRSLLTFGHYSPDDHPDHKGRQRSGLLNEVVQAAHEEVCGRERDEELVVRVHHVVLQLARAGHVA